MHKNMQVKNITKKEGGKLGRKDDIVKLYYEEHHKQITIAEILGVKQAYVSKVIKQDKRYTKEKDNRHNESVNRKKQYNNEYYKNYKRPKSNKKDTEEYYKLQALLKIDGMKLSTKKGTISDYEYAKWNSGIYETNKNGNLSVIKEYRDKIGYDVPIIVNTHKKIPSQKYKHRVCR